MPKVKQTPPSVDKQKGQRAVTTDPLYLVRYVPMWGQPNWIEANAWRRLVESQPVALDCRETLIAWLLSLDWQIEARDSDKRDELKEEIKYYTEFFNNTGKYDYTTIIEWICRDLLDLPFGGAAEVGREGDSPDGRLLWMELLDAGTLFPYPNQDYPVGQTYLDRTVYFPSYAINRVYMSPRTEIRRNGWGVAPPEKIYMTIQMIARGDSYYANLLLDTPEAGILDLIDMSKDSAELWVDAWKQMLTGIDPYKIPVLYEHTKEASWIPFTRSPTEIMFDVAIQRYTALLCSGYGMSPSDIGLGGSQGGGNTLAGTIRDERKTKRIGFTRVKKKMEAWFNAMLPKTLRFRCVDIDDETSVALGRARLANATAWGALVTAGIFSEAEARQQTVADGLITISVKEEPPPKPQLAGGNTAERPSMLGRPVSPSSGGWGETTARSIFFDELNRQFDGNDRYLQRLMYLAYPLVSTDTKGAISALEDHNLLSWRDVHEEALYGGVGGNDLPEQTALIINTLIPELSSQMTWINVDNDKIIRECNHIIEQSINDYKGFAEFRNFVEGKSDNAVLVVNTDKLAETVNLFANELKDITSRSVISGLRDYLMEYPDVSQEEATYDPRGLVSVKSALTHALNVLTDCFADKLSDIIICEENNGKTEKG